MLKGSERGGLKTGVVRRMGSHWGCVDEEGGRGAGGWVEGGGGAGRAAVWSLAVSSCKNAPSEPDDTYRQNNLCVRHKTVKWALSTVNMVWSCVCVCVWSCRGKMRERETERRSCLLLLSFWIRYLCSVLVFAGAASLDPLWLMFMTDWLGSYIIVTPKKKKKRSCLSACEFVLWGFTAS